MRSRVKYILCHFWFLVNFTVKIFLYLLLKIFTNKIKCSFSVFKNFTNMKKSELMRHYDLIMWSVFVFEWLCLISAVSVIVHEYDNIISFVCAAMIGCVAFVVGRLGDDFEKYCRTIEIDQLSHLNRFERRRLIREMRKNGDL